MKKNLDLLLAIKASKEAREKEPIRFKVMTCNRQSNSDEGDSEEKDGNEGDYEELVIPKPSPEKVIRIMDTVEPNAPVIELWDALIYAVMPELHDKELHEEMGTLNNPHSIVGKIFSYGDRVELGQAIRDVISEVSIEQIKN